MNYIINEYNNFSHYFSCCSSISIKSQTSGENSFSLGDVKVVENLQEER